MFHTLWQGSNRLYDADKYYTKPQPYVGIMSYFRNQTGSHFVNIGTVVGANLCVPRPLEVKDKGIRGVGGVADKEACTVHTKTNYFPVTVLCRSLSQFLCQ
jgi:hypothetical protein